MDQTYSKEQLLEMYYHLKNGRIFTLKMHEAVYKGLIRSSFHTPYGQEAIGVGIVSAMRKTDWLAFTHRLQTALIMRYDMTQFITELFGLRDGLKHGSAFDYHIGDYADDGVHVLDADGNENVLPADTVISAFGLRKLSAYAEAVRARFGWRVRIIGDCDKVGRIGTAVRGGYFAGTTIDD